MGHSNYNRPNTGALDEYSVEQAFLQLGSILAEIAESTDDEKQTPSCQTAHNSYRSLHSRQSMTEEI